MNASTWFICLCPLRSPRQWLKRLRSQSSSALCAWTISRLENIPKMLLSSSSERNICTKSDKTCAFLSSSYNRYQKLSRLTALEATGTAFRASSGRLSSASRRSASRLAFFVVMQSPALKCASSSERGARSLMTIWRRRYLTSWPRIRTFTSHALPPVINRLYFVLVIQEVYSDHTLLPDCKEFMECLQPGQVERCVCPTCNASFCSRCKEPFHGVPLQAPAADHGDEGKGIAEVGTSNPLTAVSGGGSDGGIGGLSCGEAAETVRRWNEWRSGGRAAFERKVEHNLQVAKKKFDQATNDALVEDDSANRSITFLRARARLIFRCAACTFFRLVLKTLKRTKRGRRRIADCARIATKRFTR